MACLGMTDEQLTQLHDFICIQLGGVDVNVDITKDELGVLACQAWRDYMEEINKWQVRNQFGNLYGTSTQTELTKYFVFDNMNLADRISGWFASMTRSGGHIPWRKDFITLEDKRQIYNLAEESSIPYSPGDRKIHRVMWFNRPEIIDYTLQGIDPHASALLSFGQSGLMWNNSPMYYLGNIFDTILLRQSLEQRNKVLFGEFYYNLSGDILELIPMPGKRGTIPNNAKIFYYYFDNNDIINKPGLDQELNPLIANPAMIKIENISYNELNSIARNWITKQTFALAKYTLGSKWRRIRRIVNPDADYEIELDYQSLLDEAKTEKEELLTSLREEMEKMNISEILKQKSEIVQATAEINNKSPRKLFWG